MDFNLPGCKQIYPQLPGTFLCFPQMVVFNPPGSEKNGGQVVCGHGDFKPSNVIQHEGRSNGSTMVQWLTVLVIAVHPRKTNSSSKNGAISKET